MKSLNALLAVLALSAAGASAASIELELHLQGRNSEAEVEEAFVARSTPGNALFRQHLNAEELTALVGAKDATVDSVVGFAKASGADVRRVLSTRDVVEVTVASGSAAAKAFGLTAADFVSATLRRPVVIPSAIAGDVTMAIASAERATPIAAKSKKAAAKKAARMAKAAAGWPGAEQTPASIKTRYNVPAADPVYPANFSQGVAEFQASYFTQQDIQTFSQKFGLTQPVVSVSGPNSPSTDNVEGTLDVEYITAISGAAHTWWISSNANGQDGTGLNFVAWAEQVLTITPQPPSVISISWGLGESVYAGKEQVLRADNAAFRKLGLRGISVLVASGDSGPGARRFLSCKVFDPSWPASSPYVTAVGATYADSASGAETSVSFSGGGFSGFFPTPSWQSAAVGKYLSNGAGLPKSSFYNATGRGFPDVAALGTNFQVYAPNPQQGDQTMWWPVSGTSCAAPTFAAVITRVNAARIGQGKPALGFLNPALYQLGDIGYDVTAGKSIDNDCYGIFPIGGFPAVAGWDAVSGLGTPDYNKLLNL